MSNPIVHHVKLLLAGVDEPLSIRVDEKVSQRVRQAFDMTSDDARFVLIDTVDGDLVAISMNDVQMANFLFEMGTFTPTEAREERILVRLRGRAEPFETATEGPEDTLRDAIASLEFNETEYVSFVDEDGEDVVLRADQIICMVVPREFLVEDDEDDDD